MTTVDHTSTTAQVSATAFATAVSAQSAAPIDLGVSPDGKTFTLTYSDFGIEVGNARCADRLAARWEWFVLPLTGDGGQGEQVTIAVSGFALCTDRAKSAVVISVNGSRRLVEFEAGSERDFVESVEYLTSGSDTEIRVAMGLLAEGEPGAAAVLNVLAVDGSLPLPDTTTS